jgi:hypothetical protein
VELHRPELVDIRVAQIAADNVNFCLFEESVTALSFDTPVCSRVFDTAIFAMARGSLQMRCSIRGRQATAAYAFRRTARRNRLCYLMVVQQYTGLVPHTAGTTPPLSPTVPC